MTMGQADKLIRIAQSYLGTSQWSDDHLAMVDAYNSVSPIPVGYRVQYGDDWCDIFVTVCGDEAGISHLIGRECGVPRHLAWFQEQGIWLGQAWPKAGDIVIFNFDGGPVDHIGIVERVQADGSISTLEGNYNGRVARAYYDWNHEAIAGYARPRYDQEGQESAPASSEDTSPSDDLITAVAWDVIRGEYGNGEERVRELTEAGYDYQTVQDRVNQLLS